MNNQDQAKAFQEEFKKPVEEKKELKKELTASFEGLVDLVEAEGKTAFLIKDGDELKVLFKVETETLLLLPPHKSKLTWLLPRAEEVLRIWESQKGHPIAQVDKELYDDLFSYHQNISELPREEYYHLITSWVLHTYLIDKFQYTPILCFFALPERGKTRTGKGIVYVAYRGIHVESLREANLLRQANDQKATLFFDVRDFWRKVITNQSDDIILLRFEKGAKVGRVLYPERGAFNDMKYFDVFGPTLIGTNENIHKILGTRSISIVMRDSTITFESEVTPEAALPMKERLTAFRARHLDDTFPVMDKPAKARLGDILRPLHQVIRLVKPENEAIFLGLIELIKSEKLDEKAETYEAQLLMAITNLTDKTENGVLSNKAITDEFNRERSEREQLTPHRVSGILRSMGFKRGTVGNGGSGILWDEKLIAKLKESYGL